MEQDKSLVFVQELTLDDSVETPVVAIERLAPGSSFSCVAVSCNN